MTSFADTTLAQMRRVSTATLTTQMFRRGFRNVFMQGVRRCEFLSLRRQIFEFLHSREPVRHDYGGSAIAI